MEQLPDTCDLLIIGGGVTGAGIFHEAARLGLKSVLVERHDFAWGTSSRSSKLIHGGLRYLKEGHFLLTRDAVKERERLLSEAPGLVTPIAFLVPVYKGRGPGRWTLEAGLSIYDLLAQKRQHRFLEADALVAQVPFIEREALNGGYEFWDAQVDDARLVLRLIAEGKAAGGTARNYTTAVTVNRDELGVVTGATLQDSETGETRSIETRAVINATGCWAEALHPQPQKKKRLRPLRGSHLIFPTQALPVHQAVSFIHPQDQRAIFAIPWEGVVLVGTTDLDHDEDLNIEPTISKEEADYLIDGVRTLFPSLGISIRQCIASLAGLRPVISSGGNRSPSEESREHDVWEESGLVTIAGGKLTTYRRVALDALKVAQPYLPEMAKPSADTGGFDGGEIPPPEIAIEASAWQRLCGRYGRNACTLVEKADLEDLKPIPGTRTLWAELPYAAANESVRHLPDLLLRRVRIGLLLPEGGKAHLARIGKLCRPALGWDLRRWHRETLAYMDHWHRTHGFPWLAQEERAVAKSLRGLKKRLTNLFSRYI